MSKYALLHNFLFAAVLKGQAQKTLFHKMLIQLFGAPEFQEMVFYLTFLPVLLRTHVVSAATGIDEGLQHNDGNILTRVDLELHFSGEQRGRI